MAMIVALKYSVNAVLLLSLVIVLSSSSCCEGKGRRVRVGLLRKMGRPGGDNREPTETVFNVLKFGAVPDEKKDNSLEFIRAWRAACDCPGKSRMIIPRGNFLAGPIVFQGPCKGPSPITVQFVGTMKALPVPSSYAEDFWISFQHINGLVLTGGGTFDGQGALIWKYNTCEGGGSCSTFPANIKLNHVSNAVIRQITSINPMGFHMGIVFSQNVKVRRVHISAAGDSPNTDGIHISQSNQVKVARSVIETGDDCIGIIQGSTDISVTKVTCGPGHGISIGSLGKYPDEKDVKRIMVSNCTLKGTTNGLRIKTWGGSPPSQATDVTFKDINMENVENPIIIDQSYGHSNAPSRVKISDIRFINVFGTTISNVAVDLTCSQQVPCERVHLSDINLKYIGPKPFTSNCVNARVNYAGMQFPPPCRS
ncbi:hypothetical protein K2173_009202 [Erythroxylum novogranatense]|uniref:Exopolygalacturonase-like n=1 Tax=Erythroxylum novogranatense TaxID=1862640 RepID=A0AAV8TKB7_9ROSI|nr:hypothetical protein K2173_009202 [Erythroxylum novogranatense]